MLSYCCLLGLCPRLLQVVAFYRLPVVNLDLPCIQFSRLGIVFPVDFEGVASCFECSLLY